MKLSTDSSFVFYSLPGRVVFGEGCLATLATEVEALGAQRALVLCTPEQREVAERVSRQLGERSAGIFDQAVMHVPIETARAARVRAAELGADVAVAVGGGSTIGLGKAIALDSGLPIIAIPTTAGTGSECTAIAIFASAAPGETALSCAMRARKAASSFWSTWLLTVKRTESGFTTRPFWYSS